MRSCVAGKLTVMSNEQRHSQRKPFGALQAPASKAAGSLQISVSLITCSKLGGGSAGRALSAGCGRHPTAPLVQREAPTGSLVPGGVGVMGGWGSQRLAF